MVWKHELYCQYFPLKLKLLGWPYIRYIKTVNNGCFLSEDEFESVLATLCCYEYGANSSEAVGKITTD